ncbi:MAG: hypothetical protein ACKODG_02735, partial [Betaproteobacteria bacterium]
ATPQRLQNRALRTSGYSQAEQRWRGTGAATGALGCAAKVAAPTANGPDAASASAGRSIGAAGAPGGGALGTKPCSMLSAAATAPALARRGRLGFEAADEA